MQGKGSYIENNCQRIQVSDNIIIRKCSNSSNDIVKETSPHLPWTNSINRVSSYPSQVISFFSLTQAVHITLDSGATSNFETLAEASRLKHKIFPPTQLAVQADGETRLHVVGEVFEKFTRGALTVSWNALVVKKLNNASLLGGMSFLIENKVESNPSKHRVIVQERFTIQETPSQILIPQQKVGAARTVTVNKVQVLLPNQSVSIILPEEMEPNETYIVEPFNDDKENMWIPQEVEAVARIVKVVNTTDEPVVIGPGKDAHVFLIVMNRHQDGMM